MTSEGASFLSHYHSSTYSPTAPASSATSSASAGPSTTADCHPFTLQLSRQQPPTKEASSPHHLPLAMPLPLPSPLRFPTELSAPAAARRVTFTLGDYSNAEEPQRRRSASDVAVRLRQESREGEVVLELAELGVGTDFASASTTPGSVLDSESVEERRALVETQVYVDVHERDGLPAVGTSQETIAEHEQQAAELTRSWKRGITFLRRKKAGKPLEAFKSGRGEGVDEEGGIAEPATLQLAAGGGILAALIALNAHPDTLPEPPTSFTSFPGPTTPGGTPAFDEEDSETDDEEERESYLATRRPHRPRGRSVEPAARDSFHRALSSTSLTDQPITPQPPSSPTPVVPLHSSSPSQSQTTRRARFAPDPEPTRASPPASPPTYPPIQRTLSASALNTLVRTVSRTSTPSPPPSPGLHRPRVIKPSSLVSKQLRRLGGHLGLEVDTVDTRPDAARSGAGVFGGLVMSTSNLLGAASPAANAIAPIPSKSGYHISRYAPPPPELERSRKSFDSPHRTASPRPGILRGRSVDSVLKATARRDSPTPILLVRGEGGGSSEQGQEEEERGRSGRPRHPHKKPSGMQLHLKDLNIPGFKHRVASPSSTSPRHESPLRDYFTPLGHHGQVRGETQEEWEKKEWAKEKRRRRKTKEKKMRHEIFITQHVAALLARQEFILKLARSLMMYGSPTHRLESQIQSTARVLELELQCIYLPGLMLISFGDSQTHTSDIKFLKQANGLDLGKMTAAFSVYNHVVRDKLGVTDASVQLDEIILEKSKYRLWQHLVIGGIASMAVMPQGFKGSFIDMVVAFPLGAMLVLVQVVASRNDLYSSLFEIVIACLNAIIAAALARTQQICFSAVASGSIVLILPGYIVLCGSLELANRSIVSGSVRLVYSLIYSLFLGFGLSVGSEIYERISGATIEHVNDFTCSALRVDAPWWRATVPQWFYLLTVPTFLLMLALSSRQPLWRRDTLVMLLIGGAGYATNFFSARVFVNKAALTSAFGAFVVSFLSNLYAKVTHTSSFTVMLAGVFVQLPSGLANGGLLRYAADSSKSAFSSGIGAAAGLVNVVVGTTVGLFMAAAVVNLVFGGGRRRGSSQSTF